MTLTLLLTRGEVPYDPGTDGFPWPGQDEPLPHLWYVPECAVVAGLEPSLLEEVTRSHWHQPQQEPVPHRLYRPASGTVTGIEPSLLEEVTRIRWDMPQQEPVPHQRFRPPQGQAVSGVEESLFVAPFDPANGFPWPGQQSPITHVALAPPDGLAPMGDFQVVAGNPGGFTTPLPLFVRMAAEPAGGAFDPANGFPWLIQQTPVEHSLYVPVSGSTAGIEPSLLEEVTRLRWDMPQQEPVPHQGFTPDDGLAPMGDFQVVVPGNPGGFTTPLPLFARTAAAPAGGAFDPANGFPWPGQQLPVEHTVYAPISGTTAGIEPSLLEEVTRSQWAQPQQEPLPHSWYVPPSGAVTGIEPSLLEEVTRLRWDMPQQEPVPHRGFTPDDGLAPMGDFQAAAPGNPGGFTVPVPLFVRMASQAAAYDPGSGFPWPPQELPVPHTLFVPASTVAAGMEPSLLEEVTRIHWMQPQQEPLPHSWYVPASQVVSGIEPSLLEEVTRIHWEMPQEEPVPHRWFKPIQGPAISGFDATTFFTFDPSTGFPYLPQQSPVPHTWFRPPMGAVAGVEPSLLEEVTRLHWVQPQQEPLPHAWYVPASATVSGQEPSLLEEVTRIHWAQPQQEPLPHAWYVPASVTVSSLDVPFDPARFPWPGQESPVPHRVFRPASEVFLGADVPFEPARFPWPPQQEPVPHRLYRPISGTAAGIAPSLLEEVTRIHWVQPQQAPVPHRRHPGLTESITGQEPGLLFDPSTGFPYLPQQAPVPHTWFRPPQGAVSGIDPRLLEEVTQVHWVQPQHPPLPIARRQVWLDQFTTGIDPSTMTAVLVYDVLARITIKGSNEPRRTIYGSYVTGRDASGGGSRGY